jgi:hypothetical protein
VKFVLYTSGDDVLERAPEDFPAQIRECNEVLVPD